MRELKQQKDYLLIQEEVYQVVGNYTEVEGPNDYELQNVKNENDELMISKVQLEENLGSNWKIINI